MPAVNSPLASTLDRRVIGSVIHNYKVVSALAEGGMGRVYLAEHQLIGRRAVVKVLRGAHAEDQRMVSRFLNEAKAANAIHHPNIVEIIDAGFLADGPPYLLMEYLEGETLAQRLSRVRRLKTNEAVHVLDQVASALQAAHAAGIIHRDLKPDNLFLVPDGESPGAERVKVVDFGIAKLQSPAGAGGTATTVGILGTPHYMSPEQCRGHRVDFRSDIYSLGVIAYEILCGTMPFGAQSAIDLMMKHISEIPKRPSTFFSDIAPHLESVTMRAMAKDPNDRFASMSEFRRALQTPSFSRSNEKPPLWAKLASVVSTSWRRHPSFWVSFAVTSAIAAGLATWSLRGDETDRAATSPRPTQPAPAAASVTPAEKSGEAVVATPGRTTSGAEGEHAAPAATTPAEAGSAKGGRGTPAARSGKVRRGANKLAGGVHEGVPF